MLYEIDLAQNVSCDIGTMLCCMQAQAANRKLDNIIIQGQMFRMGPETMKALNRGKKEKSMDPHICQLNYENLGI